MCQENYLINLNDKKDWKIHAAFDFYVIKILLRKIGNFE